MIESEIIEHYGYNVWQAMKTSHWLNGITLTMRDGQADIPEEDLDRAYRHIQGLPISSVEWD